MTTWGGRGSVTTMIGKKMALPGLVTDAVGLGVKNLPKTEEEDTKEDGQESDTDRLSLLEDLHKAVCECGDPEEPFKQSSKHDAANDGYIDNLSLLAAVLDTVNVEQTYVLDRPWVIDVWNTSVRPGHKGPDNGSQLIPHGEVTERVCSLELVRWEGKCRQKALA